LSDVELGAATPAGIGPAFDVVDDALVECPGPRGSGRDALTRPTGDTSAEVQTGTRVPWPGRDAPQDLAGELASSELGANLGELGLYRQYDARQDWIVTAIIHLVHRLPSRVPADCHEFRSYLHEVLAEPQDIIALPHFRRWSRALKI
jgi:hypothetical protein